MFSLNHTSSNYSNIKSRAFSTKILMILLLCSALLNILLARNISSLRADVHYLKEELSSAYDLKLGELLPSVHAKDLEGNYATIDYSGTGPATILYIFTPACVWCTRNLENIKSLADQTKSGYRIIGISLSKDKLQDYVIEHNFTFPVYTELSAETISAYKMGGTPRTLVISSKGELVRNWFGAYGSDLKEEVEAYFKLNLPGITESGSNEKEKGKECEACK
jgi:peroxiredoxin